MDDLELINRGTVDRISLFRTAVVFEGTTYADKLTTTWAIRFCESIDIIEMKSGKGIGKIDMFDDMSEDVGKITKILGQQIDRVELLSNSLFFTIDDTLIGCSWRDDEDAIVQIDFSNNESKQWFISLPNS